MSVEKQQLQKCRVCQGSGVIREGILEKTCLDCGGAGAQTVSVSISESELCELCEGTGRYPTKAAVCPTCHGGGLKSTPGIR